MRRRHILIGTLALAVVVATIGGVAYALHARAQSQADGKSYPGLHAPVSVVCPGPTYTTNGLGRPYQADQGAPVIHPRNDCTPSFTQQDVRDYVAHGAFLGFGIGVEGRPTITRVIFLTIRDLSRVSSDPAWASFGLSMKYNDPPDMLVCYAGLSGTFVTPPTSTSAAFIVIDAHTGNQIVTGLGAPLG